MSQNCSGLTPFAYMRPDNDSRATIFDGICRRISSVFHQGLDPDLIWRVSCYLLASLVSSLRAIYNRGILYVRYRLRQAARNNRLLLCSGKAFSLPI